MLSFEQPNRTRENHNIHIYVILFTNHNSDMARKLIIKQSQISTTTPQRAQTQAETAISLPHHWLSCPHPYCLHDKVKQDIAIARCILIVAINWMHAHSHILQIT